MDISKALNHACRPVSHLVLISTLFMTSLASAAGPSVFELVSGVVVDQANSRVYAMHPEMSVEALDLANGNRIWISPDAEKPLWVQGSTVYAQETTVSASGNLDILMLDAATGGSQTQRIEIDLPAGVVPWIDRPGGKKFDVRFEKLDDRVSVRWRYIDQSKVSKPAPDAPPPSVRREQGALLFNPADNTMAPVPDDQVSVLGRSPSRITALVDSGALAEPFWLLDGMAAFIEEIPGKPGMRAIILKRWDAATGEALDDELLFDGRVVAGRLSADGQHYLVVSAAGRSEAGRPLYQWTIFSLATGERVTELTFNRSAAPFSVADGSLLVVNPPYGHKVDDEWVEVAPSVRRLDLQSGSELWTVEIRDTFYRGPFPSNRQTP